MFQSPDTHFIRLGIIVPSSKTVLESLTQKIISTINSTHPHLSITVHFSRFRVTKIAISQDVDAQFTLQAMLPAAELLAEAKVDAIGWSGTSASWLGFETDEILCRSIEARTGIPATTSVLAMNEIMRRRGVRNVGLITPYLEEVNIAIRKTYEIYGFDIAAERSRWASLSTNVEFAALSKSGLDEMVNDVVRRGAETVLVMCTNIAAAEHWEDQYRILVLDSIATVVHGLLEKLQIRTVSSSIEEWGSIFDSK